MSWRDYRSAPAPGTVVCPADGAGASCHRLTGPAGTFGLIVVQGGDGPRGYVNACPHQYLPLDYRGTQIETADGARLICSAHGAEFDRLTGAPVRGADEGLEPVPLAVRNGMIVIGD